MAKLDQSTIDGINNSLGGSSLANKYIDKANQQLMSNANYLNSLLKMQQVQDSIKSTTNSTQKDISNAANSVLDGTYQARNKQSQSGMGATGLGAMQGLSTQQNDQNLETKLESAADSDRSANQSYDLYNQNVQNTLKEKMSMLLNQDIRNSSYSHSEKGKGFWGMFGGEKSYTDNGYDAGGAGNSYNGGVLSGEDIESTKELEKELMEQTSTGNTDPISTEDRQKAEASGGRGVNNPFNNFIK